MGGGLITRQELIDFMFRQYIGTNILQLQLCEKCQVKGFRTASEQEKISELLFQSDLWALTYMRLTGVKLTNLGSAQIC